MPSVTKNEQMCICQICTCGRHRCPLHPGASTLQLGQNGDATKDTEYNSRYKDNEGVPREPLRRAKDQIGLPTDRLDDATTTRTDYAGQKGTRPQAFHGVDNLRPQGEMDMNTVYKDQYNQKSVPRNIPLAARKLDNLVPSSAKFDAQPSYKEDYPAWPTERTERVRRSTREPDGVKFGSGDGNTPFDGSTTLRSDYQGLPGERARLIKPQTAPLISSGAVQDGLSITRQDYRPWEVTRMAPRKQEEYIRPEGSMDMNTTHRNAYRENQPLGERAKATRPATSTKLGSGTMEGLTTKSEAYKGVTGEKATGFKPTVAALQRDGDFDGATTQRSDYTDKSNDVEIGPRGRRRQYAQDPYVKPDGDMDFNTVTRTDYKNGVGDGKQTKTKSMRPVTSQRTTGAFDGTTTHGLDFPGWMTKRQQPTPPRLEYIPPLEKFDGQTTNRSDYAGHGDFSDRVRPSRPSPHRSPLDDDGKPFDGTTSYHSQYVRHNTQPCPAEGLHGDGLGNDKFRFKVKLGGHHFYLPTEVAAR